MKNRAIIKLHYSCNNYCLFCHSDRHKDSAVSMATLLEKVDRARSLGINQVLLSGGEPTIYPQLKELLVNLRKRKLQTGFISNGRMFSYEPFVKRCLKMGAQYFYISLHSHKQEIHDQLTGSRDSWQQAYQGIRNIAQYGGKQIKLIVNCVITKKNIDHLSELVKLLAPLPKVTVKFSLPEFKGRANSHISQLCEDLKEVGGLLNQAMQTADAEQVQCCYDGLPFCYINNRYRHRINTLETDRIFYMSEVFESQFFRTDESDRQHGEECYRCSYCEICPGVYRGYSTQQLKPVSTTVPNFFTLHQVEKLRKQECLLDEEPSYGQLPFKRVALEHNDAVTLYEFQDSFFKINNFLETKATNRLFQLAPDRSTQSWDGNLANLSRLIRTTRCSNCQKSQCPGIYKPEQGSSFFSLNHKIEKRLRKIRGTVLDVGFGACFFRNLLSNKEWEKLSYFGIEPDSLQFRKATAKMPNAKLYNTTIEKFKHPGNSFDYVMMLGSFDHIQNVQKGLDIVYDLLKDSGKLIIVENQPFGIISPPPAESLFNGGFPFAGTGHEHYRNASLDTAVTFAEKANFTISERIGHSSDGGTFWFLECGKNYGNDQERTGQGV